MNSLHSPTAPHDELIGTAQELHRELLRSLDLRRCDVISMPADALRQLAAAAIATAIASRPLPPGLDAPQLAQFVLDEALGLGPLEALLRDSSVTEIMVNGPNEIFVERAGQITPVPIRFSSEAALRGVIERIVAPLGRRVDDASPMVDARLGDGSRVNVVLPPLAVRGPVVTIRRFQRGLRRVEDLLAAGTLSEPMLDFLALCVRHRRNIVISGGTGSGKTTLLNVLSSLIPAEERLVTIEDAAELALEHRNLVSLEARQPNAEGRGEVTIRDLVRNALRMRPDRIVIGECRGGEALDMLQAMNTGHEGSLTTVHANSPRDVLSRLEVMALMSGLDLPATAIREQIAAAVNIVVHQVRFSSGLRRVTSIAEVTGIESGRIQMQELFRFRGAALDSTGFEALGIVPAFYERLARAGITIAPANSAACP